MNIPAAFVRRYIAERLQRYVGSVNDMMFLALQQDTGIGALSYHYNLNLPKPSAENLEDLLHWDDKRSAFEYLSNKYLFQTSISGVQPKVMVSAESKEFPNRDSLLKFAKALVIIKPEQTIEKDGGYYQQPPGQQ